MAREKRFYLVNDVVSILGISRKTIYNWERAGKIPRARRDKLSNYRIYTMEDIKKLQRITGRK